MPDDILIFDEPLSDEEKQVVNRPEGGETTYKGGYYDEVVPLTTSREEAHLTTGLGGSSDYDWDVFDPFAIKDGSLLIQALRRTGPVPGHLAQLITGGPRL